MGEAVTSPIKAIDDSRPLRRLMGRDFRGIERVLFRQRACDREEIDAIERPLRLRIDFDEMRRSAGLPRAELGELARKAVDVICRQ
jgi:hypothetical protein